MRQLPQVGCGPRLEVMAVPGFPIVEAGDDLAELCVGALARAGVELERQHDVLVITSKVVSRAEDRFVELASVQPSPRALELSARTGKDPRLVELILSESRAVSRAAKNVLISRHRLGFVSANGGIDESNVCGQLGRSVLLLPRDPDGSAARIRARVRERFGADVGVIVSDSHGRAFRVGSVGMAIGVSGVPALWDQRGRKDLHGRPLEVTVTALADQIAAAADLVAGQADEGRALVLVRGLSFETDESARATELLRPEHEDLYA